MLVGRVPSMGILAQAHYAAKETLEARLALKTPRPRSRLLRPSKAVLPTDNSPLVFSPVAEWNGDNYAELAQRAAYARTHDPWTPEPGAGDPTTDPVLGQMMGRPRRARALRSLRRWSRGKDKSSAGAQVGALANFAY
jgi:hypothetical protein